MARRFAPSLGLALALLVGAAAPLLPGVPSLEGTARADEPAPPETADAALAAWRARCDTRRVRPDVPEAGEEAITALTSLGIAPAEALKLVDRAAFSNDWSAEKVRAWKDALTTEAASATRSGDAWAERAWEALGKKRPAKEAPLPAEAPGARRFEAGAGPTTKSVRVRWQGGDLEQASAMADPDPDEPGRMPPGPAWVGFSPLSAEAAKAAGVGDGASAPKVARYLVILTKDAVVWWTAELDAFFTGKTERFVFGAVIVPRGDEPRFRVVDPGARLGWRAAYVFADVGGKRIALPRESVAFEKGKAPEAEAGEVRVEVGAK